MGVAGRKMPERRSVCAICGKPISPPRRAYCSNKCSKTANHRKEREVIREKRRRMIAEHTFTPLDGEVWKAVPGFEGEYEVSNFGRVRTLDFYRTTKQGKQYPVSSRILRQAVNNGYLHVGLAHNGHYKRFRVHRLVAEVFIPNHDGKPFVNHIDCDKQNNCVENLEWVTAKENTEHAIAHGLIKSNTRPMIKARRKPVVRDDGTCYPSMTAAAKAAGVMTENMSYHILHKTKVPADSHLYQYA